MGKSKRGRFLRWLQLWASIGLACTGTLAAISLAKWASSQYAGSIRSIAWQLVANDSLGPLTERIRARLHETGGAHAR